MTKNLRRSYGGATDSTTPIRCAIYTRKSTTEGLDSDFSSLDAQREAGDLYIRSQAGKGWTPLPTRYDDGGCSGADLDRPALALLIDDIKRGAVDCVVVYKVDRLSRSLLDFARLMEVFDKHNVAFVSITQQFDTSTSMGRLVLNMLLSFAQFEREMIAERTRDKIRASRRRGKWTGGAVPFGYKVVGKRLVPKKPEADTVRRLFQLYLEDRSTSALAWVLNRESAGATSEAKPVLAWSKDRIARILRNPVYAGFTVAGSELCQGEHAALISRDVFDRTIERLESRRTVTSRISDPDYLLRGLLRCGECGHALVPASTCKDKKKYRYYRCSLRNHHDHSVCRTPQMSAPALEEFVRSELGRTLQSSGLASGLLRSMEARAKRLRAERAEIPRLIAQRSARAAQLATALTELRGALRHAPENELRELATEVQRLEERQRQVQRELGSLEGAQRADAERLAPVLKRFEQNWLKLVPTEQGALLTKLLSQVTVADAGERIELHLRDWLFPEEPSAGGGEAA